MRPPPAAPYRRRVSNRELIALGTGSQVPSRARNHNGYLLRWDSAGFLFDPGEGTQRQLTFAGVPASAVTRICLTHFHGDHCLGVPGVVQRLSLDGVARVHAHYPASGQEYFERLRHASVFHETTELVEQPVTGDGVVAGGEFGELSALRLDHPVEAYGYRLAEPDGRAMVPRLLRRHGVQGRDVGALLRAGSLAVGGRTVTVEDVSVPRRGQKFAFVMDTRLCDNAFALAEDADLLVIEATFLEAEADLARRYGHLTARQAARVAQESGVRTLVLTHFSQRYSNMAEFHDQAAEVFGGELVVAHDLSRIPIPRRPRPE
ncbi:metal-dependent hydrolase, beta-lactamase superfamily III [Saccharomonospora cyanea NA-134]|uniref:Ribonuclease Z n=1 Tax=Saccharomonospora cyanea NA-134 TaxID=882082 RepID=H5XLI6_9PSEU|nr:metal-dependent hydrolase, beta-lactamase superfamily III [Saccharomonospora cyanea NA-134]